MYKKHCTYCRSEKLIKLMHHILYYICSKCEWFFLNSQTVLPKNNDSIYIVYVLGVYNICISIILYTVMYNFWLEKLRALRYVYQL